MGRLTERSGTRDVEVVRVGGDRLRVGPWRAADGVGIIAPLTAGRAPERAAIDVAVDRLRGRGFHRVVTPALAATEQRSFLDAGFQIEHRLHLLVHQLVDTPTIGRRRGLRRGRISDHLAVLAVDELAFPPFWRLDEAGLRDALGATPSSRLRVHGRPIDAYAVWGRAGDRGYLQRLAVDPAAQGQGLATALIADGLRWLGRWRVREVLVNTQESNERALQLYERTGFRRRSPGLAVLTLDLAGTAR